MQFNTVQSPMDRTYYANPEGYLGDFSDAPIPDIETTINVKDVGQSVPEGQQLGGSFIQTTQNAIKAGAGKLELSTSMGGGHEAVGAEAYGEDARIALREISKVNQAEFVSVHTPVQVGNMSGYNQQERGFSDEHRKMGMEEVRKAIDFAADVNGGAVVVHTGEYQRDMSDQSWAKNPDGSYKFLGYDEEPGKSVLYMVDDRTGKMITEVRKSMVHHEPDFEQKLDSEQGRMRWVNGKGEFIDEDDPNSLMFRQPKWDSKRKQFQTRRMDWNQFVQRANDWNKWNKREDGREWTPEELFFRSQMETRVLQSRGHSLYHGQRYEEQKEHFQELQKAYKYAKSIENHTSKEDQWKLLEEYGGRQITRNITLPSKNKLLSEILKEQVEQAELGLRHTHESSAAADAQADETIEQLDHIKPVSVYAKEQSRVGFAQAGLYAREQSQNNPHSKKDVFVAPENIFPEMGYGSHPEELIELVQDAREQMVHELTSKMIDSPQRLRNEKGDLVQVANPNYEASLSQADAQQEANKHIKATLDTQHLGMWWKHFTAKPGESKEVRKERFDHWYMDQIKKMEDADIIGHIHVVDAIGAGHQHLPVGQGNLPVRKALEYLKKKGYGGTMIAEGHGEDRMHGPGRILTETWKGLGVPIQGAGYRMGAPAQSWGNIQNGYLGVTQNPYFIFGSYSPSNDWQLWSQVPME
jgi:hypothetical protein